MLIDEKKGYNVARTMEIQALRTTSVLMQLKEAGAISAVKPYLEKLEETGFHLGRKERFILLEQANEQE